MAFLIIYDARGVDTHKNNNTKNTITIKKFNRTKQKTNIAYYEKLFICLMIRTQITINAKYKYIVTISSDNKYH